MKEKTIKITISREMVLPSRPNFIKSKDGTTVSVAELSQEELRFIGAAWTEELMKKGKK